MGVPAMTSADFAHAPAVALVGVLVVAALDQRAEADEPEVAFQASRVPEDPVAASIGPPVMTAHVPHHPIASRRGDMW